jgi:hypothetical protein
MKKTTILSVFIGLAMMFTLANFNPTHAQQTVEDQYWEAVKNSTDVEDLKSYLTEYPNGKYAALARLKIKQSNSGNTGNSSSGSFLSFKVSTAMTNEAFMERWENQIRTQLPIKYGEDEIYRAQAPSTLENYFYTSVRTPNLTNVNIRTQSNALKAKLLPEYCKSEAYQRKITLVLGYRDATSGYSNNLAPNDCSALTTSKQQTDAEYLNSWAAEVRIDLPEMIGGFQLTDAWSRCPAGCKQKDRPTYLLLKFNALNNQKNAPIAQLKQSLMPLLLVEYCKSDAIRRKIALGVFFDNRDPNRKVNFWVEPTDCPKKTA